MHEERFADLGVGGLALVVYLSTLAPGISTGDSGELVTAAATLSLAHPTGYPLYLLLGNAAIHLFGFVSPAVAMNLFSAVAAVGACLVVRRLTLVLTGDRVAAVATALLVGFSPSFWSQATAARVYALGALLFALALLELARLFTRTGGSLARAWLWFGLGMANHTVMLIVAPLLAYASLATDLSLAARVRAATACLPGVALYAYIPIAASLDPVQSWGNPSLAGAEGFDRLLAYLSRESFWSKRFVHEAGDLWLVAAHYLDSIPVELTWPGVALVVLGLYAPGPGRRWVVGVGLYLFAANLALMAWHGSRQDIFYWPRYVISGWMALALIAGLGMARVRRELPRPWLGGALVALAPALALVLGYGAASRAGHTWAHDFNRQLLESLEPGAVLFAEEDNVVFPLSYLRHVEGLRRDVEVVMQGVNRLDQMAIAPDATPTYFTHIHDLGVPALTLVPDGLVFRLVRAGSEFRGRPWQQVALPSFEAVEVPGHDRYLDRSLVGNYYFMKAINLETSDPPGALQSVRRLRAVSFDNAVNQVNAGLLLERNLRFAEAFEAFGAAASIDPRNELATHRTRFWRETLARAAAVRDDTERAELIALALTDAGRVDLALELLESSRP